MNRTKIATVLARGAAVLLCAGLLGMSVTSAVIAVVRDAGTVADLNRIRGAKVEERVTFGSYEQDNNHANGKEPITWIVLYKDKEKALLISEQCLVSRPYHDKEEPVTWENSAMRRWLNGQFFRDAFSGTAAAYIQQSELWNYDHPKGNDGGNDTVDRVFLLSQEEIQLHFYFFKEEKKVTGSKFAVANGLTRLTEGRCRWWLRASGESPDQAMFVFGRGSADSCSVTADGIGIRPAVWVKLD